MSDDKELIVNFNSKQYTLINGTKKMQYMQYDCKGDNDVKVLRFSKQYSLKKDYLKKFRNMFEILNKFSHENIQKILGYSVNSDDIYVLLEGSKKTVMSELKDKVSFTELEVGKIFIDLINGLAKLHEENIAHLDICPENIFKIGETYKLDNFYCAVAIGQATSIEYNGTVNYLAPEIFSSSEAKNPKAADIWAAGITLLTLMLGKIQFPTPHNEKMTITEKKSILNLKITEWEFEKEYVEPEMFPEDLKRLLKNMLTKEAEKRITVENILKDNWFVRMKKEVEKSKIIFAGPDMINMFSNKKKKVIRNIIYNIIRQSLGHIYTIKDLTDSSFLVNSKRGNLTSVITIVKINDRHAIVIKKVFCNDQNEWDSFHNEFQNKFD